MAAGSASFFGVGVHPLHPGVVKMFVEEDVQLVRRGDAAGAGVVPGQRQCRKPHRRKKTEPQSREIKLGEKESLEMFADSFSLTEREKEVLEVLLVSDENVQDIAETLMISRAALYRHIASINEKTGTKSRIGLVQFYYRYHRRNEG